MGFKIALLRDDFTDNTESPAWNASVTIGSATKAETSGQARLTLPSSVAGSHLAAYTTSAAYDLTGDGFVWNIETMVSTAVAATVYFQLYDFTTGNNQLLWRQLSNAITCRTFVAGVETQHFTATWSSSTYKYLRIRESGGTIFWDSSTNGTSWTNRHSMAAPFAVTDLHVQFAAECGNVASPGSLRLDDVNLILPAPSATWRETTADWSITNRLRPVTLASDGGKQGVIVTADNMDSSRVLSGNLRYFGGPLGSSSGGYLALTEYASLVLAQASPFPVPIDGRVDLPALIDARFTRLYHRSIDASGHNIYEFVPRRMVQADDIEAESIRAINISAGAITADKIFVLDLSAITATIGQLTIASSQGLNAWLYQGTGTGDAPTTGLKIFNSGGIGKLSTYNATVEQVTLDTDGKLKAGAGTVVLDADGIVVIASTSYLANRSYGFTDGTNRVSDLYVIEGASQHSLNLTLASKASRDSLLSIFGDAPTGKVSQIVLTARLNGVPGAQITLANGGGNPGVSIANADVSVLNGGVSVGTTGATTGQIATSGSVGFGVAAQSNVRLFAKGQDSTSSNYCYFGQDSGGNTLFYVRDDGAVLIGKSGAALGFYGSGGSTRPTVTGSRGGNAALASLLTALAGQNLLVDSSTA